MTVILPLDAETDAGSKSSENKIRGFEEFTAKLQLLIDGAEERDPRREAPRSKQRLKQSKSTLTKSETEKDTKIFVKTKRRGHTGQRPHSMISEDQRAREPESRRVVNQTVRNKASKPKVRHKDPKQERPEARHKGPKRDTKARSETQRPEARQLDEPEGKRAR